MSENENLTNFRLESLEKKFDAYIKESKASMVSMEAKIDRLPDGMIGRREFEDYRKTIGERLSGLATKEEVKTVSTKVSGHDKIFIFIATGVGGALILALMNLLLRKS